MTPSKFRQKLNWLLSFIVPVKMGTTVTSSDLPIDEKVVRAFETVYTLNPDLQFDVEGFSGKEPHVRVRLRIRPGKRVISIDKPLFRLLFTQKEIPKVKP